MNKRQKKKLYKKKTGKNPPKWMGYSGQQYHIDIAGGSRRPMKNWRQQEKHEENMKWYTNNIINLTEILTRGHRFKGKAGWK